MMLNIPWSNVFLRLGLLSTCGQMSGHFVHEWTNVLVVEHLVQCR
jgi:hypothetical protein